MKALGYYIFFTVNWIITLLPLKILYILSDAFYLLMFYILRYRRDVVKKNLENAYPGKTPGELRSLSKKYYRHLCDTFVETFKITHMSKKELSKRFILENPETLDELYLKGKDIIAVLGHYNNWEMLTAFPLYTSYRCISIYRPLKNEYFDRFIYNLRSKHGMVLTPTSSIMRELLAARASNVRTLSCFLADQTPAKSDIHYWTNFLNQETAVYLGAEKIAAKYNMAVVFFNFTKEKRGVYRLKTEVLFENSAGLPEHLITDTHVKRLETLINSAPEYWIWSHRRWKHKKEKQD